MGIPNERRSGTAVRRSKDRIMFYFDRNGTAGIAFRAVDKTGGRNNPQCIIISPEIGVVEAPQSVDGSGLFEIPGGRALPMPSHSDYKADLGAIPPGALLIAGESQFVSFRAGSYTGYANITSGEIQVNAPEPPRGWFTKWRLMQQGPNDFEQVIEIKAVDPR
jgi:hypothetical protein